VASGVHTFFLRPKREDKKRACEVASRVGLTPDSRLSTKPPPTV